MQDNLFSESESAVAAVWLRDNSPHPDNIDSVSFGRKLLMSQLNLDVKIEEVHQTF